MSRPRTAAWSALHQRDCLFAALTTEIFGVYIFIDKVLFHRINPATLPAAAIRAGGSVQESSMEAVEAGARGIGTWPEIAVPEALFLRT